jgi:hypothetical protein
MAKQNQKTNLALVEPSKLATINADIDTLNTAVSKLREADKELAKEDIALRQMQGLSRDAELRQVAAALLDGPNAAPVQTNAKRLTEITEKRRAIAKALEIADERMLRLLFNQVIERRKDAAEPWAELQRQRALAVARLVSLNRRAQAMLAPLIDPRGHVDMPAVFAAKPAGAFLLGNGSVRGGDADVFLTTCITAGIITQDELDKEQN